jgi:hypothetical protein
MALDLAAELALSFRTMKKDGRHRRHVAAISAISSSRHHECRRTAPGEET